MNKEIWKPIVGYEGLYEVSSLGRVKSLARNTTSGKVLRQTKDHCGYYRCTLTKDGVQKVHRVHRLVGIAFIKNNECFPFINHKDENKENNHVDNLEWCDAKYNLNYGNCTKKMALSKGKPFVCVENNKTYYNQGDCAKELGVSRGGISQVLCGIRPHIRGFHFVHID